MTTTQLANLCSTKYFVEYICEDLNDAYYQLVRASDELILCAFTEIEYVFSYCFQHGINHNEVTVW